MFFDFRVAIGYRNYNVVTAIVTVGWLLCGSIFFDLFVTVALLAILSSCHTFAP
jgi:hypothetical protein